MVKPGVAGAALIFGLSTTTAAAFDWYGFRSGMTPDEIRDTAAAQGLTLDRQPDQAANVTVPLYSDEDGGARGFLTMCQGQLARVGTELQPLDVTLLARKVDQYEGFGEAGVRTMTMETGARAVQLSWFAETDEVSMVLVKLGDQQLMQETMADIGLWDLCANTGVALDEEPADDFEPVEDPEPPTPEELLLDALGRALRGEDRENGR